MNLIKVMSKSIGAIASSVSAIGLRDVPCVMNPQFFRDDNKELSLYNPQNNIVSCGEYESNNLEEESVWDKILDGAGKLQTAADNFIDGKVNVIEKGIPGIKEFAVGNTRFIKFKQALKNSSKYQGSTSSKYLRRTAESLGKIKGVSKYVKWAGNSLIGISLVGAFIENPDHTLDEKVVNTGYEGFKIWISTQVGIAVSGAVVAGSVAGSIPTGGAYLGLTFAAGAAGAGAYLGTYALLDMVDPVKLYNTIKDPQTYIDMKDNIVDSYNKVNDTAIDIKDNIVEGYSTVINDMNQKLYNIQCEIENAILGWNPYNNWADIVPNGWLY